MTKRFTIALAMVCVGLLAVDAQVILRYGPEIDCGWGDANCVVTPYVSFPGSFTRPYSGNAITKVSIGLAQDASNCYLYIKDKPENPEYIYRQKLGGLTVGWNEIILDTPFTIEEGKDIAIGYKASFTEKNGVGYSKEIFSDGDRIYYNSQNSWTSTGGSVCIRAYVEGENMPADEMLIGKITDRVAGYEDETVTFLTVVRNVGANTVDNYEVVTTFDGVESRMIIEKNILVNDSDTVRWEVPSTAVGTHDVRVRIDTVNGNTDFYDANNEASARLTVRDKVFARRVVCEEYGGTWCGFCPRGIVGLEMMTEAYPDRFIGISVHGGDPLEIDPESDYSYREFIETCPGAPMCNVNRKLTGDPYIDIQNLYNLESNADNHIAYELSAVWNADSTAIDVISTYYADCDIASPKLNVAYTITEDSITGYAQTNYYAGGRNGELCGWEDKDELTTDFVYNDIARSIYGGYHGMECRTEGMTAFEKYTHAVSVPLPPNVSDRRNVKITGQIIDSAGGSIINAMRVKPCGENSGIATHSSEGMKRHEINVRGKDMFVKTKSDECSILTVYNLSGRICGKTDIRNGEGNLHISDSGVYIVRIEDGRTHIVSNYKISIQ